MSKTNQIRINVTVNNTISLRQAEPRLVPIHLLREALGLTGPHILSASC